MGADRISPDAGSVDSRLHDLVEELTDRAGRDSTDEIVGWIAGQAEHTSVLRSLFPSLRRLQNLRQPIGSQQPWLDVSIFIGKSLGDFYVIRELGRGGMGVVFEADQLSLRRRVALKVLPPHQSISENRIKRFRNEAHAIARLSHPHIVDIYSVGVVDGTHHFAMRLIDGSTAAEFLFDGLSFAERCAQVVTWGIQAADALGHAHAAGIIHRDIKPSNLLIDDTGKLWVTDFGVARLTSEEKLTQSDNIVGTLRYMSPEQALSDGAPLDHRSDLYSLGAVLFELISDTPLLSGDSPAALMRQLADSSRLRLRQLVPTISPELDTIVNKSIATHPDDRYENAAAMSADLKAFIEGRPIQARPPTLWRRFELWRLRNLVLVRTIVAFVVILLFGAAASFLLLDHGRRERLYEQALRIEQQRLVDFQRQIADQNGYAGSIQLAFQAWRSANPEQMQVHLDNCLPQGNSTDWRSFEWYYLRELLRSIPPPIGRHDGEAYWIEFDVDGESMSTFGDDGYRVWSTTDWTLQRHEPDRTPLDQERAVWATVRRVSSIVLTSNDAHVRLNDDRYIVGNSSGKVALIDPATGDSSVIVNRDRRVAALAVSPDQKVLAVGDGEGEVTFYQLQKSTATEMRTIRMASNATESLFLMSFPTAPDATSTSYRFVSSSRDGTAVYSILVFERGTIREDRRQVFRHTCPLWCARIDAKAEFLVTVDRRGAVIRWELAENHLQNPRIRFDADFESLSTGEKQQLAATSPFYDLSADSRMAATIDADGALLLWDLSSNRILRKFTATQLHALHPPFQASHVFQVKFSPGGKRLALMADGQTHLFQLQADEGSLPQLVAEQTLAGASRFYWHPNAELAVVADAGSSLEVVDLDSAKPLQHLMSNTCSIAYTPDKARLIGCRYEGFFKIWDAHTLEELAQFAGPGHALVAISADGRTLATASGREIILWNLASLREMLRIPMPQVETSLSLAFSRRGDALVLGFHDRDRRGQFVWELRDLDGEATFWDGKP